MTNTPYWYFVARMCNEKRYRPRKRGKRKKRHSALVFLTRVLSHLPHLEHLVGRLKMWLLLLFLLGREQAETHSIACICKSSVPSTDLERFCLLDQVACGHTDRKAKLLGQTKTQNLTKRACTTEKQ